MSDKKNKISRFSIRTAIVIVLTVLGGILFVLLLTGKWNFSLKEITKTYPINKSFDTLKILQTDFETQKDWLTLQTKTNHKAHSGQFSQSIDKNSPYSGGFKGRIPAETDFIQISADIFCESNTANPQLIYELARNTVNSIYNTEKLESYLQKNQWTSFYYTIPIEDNSRNMVSTYFYNPTTDKIWIDNLEIIFGKFQ